jgi:hypothetical protein
MRLAELPVQIFSCVAGLLYLGGWWWVGRKIVYAVGADRWHPLWWPGGADASGWVLGVVMGTALPWLIYLILAIGSRFRSKAERQ